MIQFKDLSLRRGTDLLIKNANVMIQPQQRIGIIGKNGCGKSTLLGLLLNTVSADSGSCYINPSCSLSHLAQETPSTDRQALDYVIDADQEYRVIQQRLAIANEAGNSHEIAICHQELDRIDGYSITARAAKIITGLGFAHESMQQSVKEFSGGWRMRLNLARALLKRSDILLLDEPTNHLDLDALLWLEQWLLRYPGILLLVSHDREFLDRIVTHIIHVEQQDLHLYTGNYNQFVSQRAERLMNQQQFYERQQRERAKLQQFIDRFRAKASKAKQAQSRIKALARMEAAVPAFLDNPFQFEFKEPERNPNPLLKLENVAISYGDQLILNKVNCSIEPTARIGILGINGAGKSTLIKFLAGVLPKRQGKVTHGLGINIGYFAQHQLEQLHLQLSPLAHLQALDDSIAIQVLRDFLGGFGFHGDKALQPIEHFSGGEKARLALALIVWQRPNLLLLDEPTNHFDIEMRQAMISALQAFSGAVVIVSHDRFLLRTCCEQLWLVDNHMVNDFDGDIDGYQTWFMNLKNKTPSSPDVEPEKTTINPRIARQNAAQERLRKQPLQKRLQQIEAALEKNKSSLASIAEQLLASELYAAENKPQLLALLQQQTQLQQENLSLESEWFVIHESLDEQ